MITAIGVVIAAWFVWLGMSVLSSAPLWTGHWQRLVGVVLVGAAPWIVGGAAKLEAVAFGTVLWMARG